MALNLIGTILTMTSSCLACIEYNLAHFIWNFCDIVFLLILLWCHSYAAIMLFLL